MGEILGAMWEVDEILIRRQGMSYLHLLLVAETPAGPDSQVFQKTSGSKTGTESSQAADCQWRLWEAQVPHAQL